MASFKASHPKHHNLTSAHTGGERRSLDVRAHPKGPWRRVVKKLTLLPSKEIAGLKKKMMIMMMKMMTPGSQDSRVWEFSYEALKVHRGPLVLCIGSYILTSGVFW